MVLKIKITFLQEKHISKHLFCGLFLLIFLRLSSPSWCFNGDNDCQGQEPRLYWLITTFFNEWEKKTQQLPIKMRCLNCSINACLTQSSTFKI